MKGFPHSFLSGGKKKTFRGNSTPPLFILYGRFRSKKAHGLFTVFFFSDLGLGLQYPGIFFFRFRSKKAYGLFKVRIGQSVVCYLL